MFIAWTNAAGSTDIISIDAVVTELHSAQAEVTSHPVETGSAISDNVIPGPLKISCQCTVTNTPVTIPASHMSGATGSSAGQKLTFRGSTEIPAGSAELLHFDTSFDRVRDVHSDVKRLMAAGTIIEVSTSLVDYDNMLITNLSVPRSAQSGNALTFSFDAQQVTIVSTQEVTVAAPSKSKIVHRETQTTKDIVPDNNDTALRRTVKEADKAYDRAKTFLGLGQ